MRYANYQNDEKNIHVVETRNTDNDLACSRV